MATNIPSSFVDCLPANGDATVNGAKTFSAAPAVVIDDATNTGITTALTLSHTTTGTAAAGIGARMLIRAESGAGNLASAASFGAEHTDATDGAEVSRAGIFPCAAGAIGAGLRVQAVASAVNGFEATVAATAGTPTLAPYGSDTNITAALKAKGTGALQVQTPGGTTIFSVLSTGGLTVYADTQTGASPTVSRPAGKVRVQSGGATVTVTNTLVTTSSLILVTPQSAPTNAVYVKSVVPGSGSFVITLSGDPGASHLDLAFLVLN